MYFRILIDPVTSIDLENSDWYIRGGVFVGIVVTIAVFLVVSGVMNVMLCWYSSC